MDGAERQVASVLVWRERERERERDERSRRPYFPWREREREMKDRDAPTFPGYGGMFRV